jgi:hypothetical protein
VREPGGFFLGLSSRRGSLELLAQNSIKPAAGGALSRCRGLRCCDGVANVLGWDTKIYRLLKHGVSVVMKTKHPSRWKRTALNTAVCVAIASFTPLVMAADQTVSSAQTTAVTLTGTDSLTVTSTGSITAAARFGSGSASGAVYVDSAATGVTIDNSGTIATGKVEYGAAIGLDSAATGTKITNETAGVIQAQGYGVSGIGVAGALDGSLVNKGQVLATGSEYATGIYVGRDVTGQISNSGTVAAQASSSSAYAAGIDTGSLSGAKASITNSGTITAAARSYSSSATAYGIRTGDLSGAGATITNTSTGTITATAAASTSSSSGRSAYAYGIGAGDLSGSAASINNAGTITATATAVYGSATAYGIDTGSLSGTGAGITNSGSITAAARSYSSSAAAYGIRAGDLSGAGATITNTSTGTITATAAASTNSSGSRRAYAYGISAGDLIGSGASINNAGIITATASANADVAGSGSGSGSGYGSSYGIFNLFAGAYGISAHQIGMGSTVTNSGTVNASADSYARASGYGISADSLASGASIVNAQSGVINASAAVHGSGPSYDIWGVAAGIYTKGMDDNSSISNSGSISATATGDASGHVFAAGIDTINHSSSVSAFRISSSKAGNGGLGAGASIVNSGSITATATSAHTYVLADATGILAGDLGAGASVANVKGGVITVSATGQTSAGASAFGLNIGTLVGPGASVTNLGTISVTAAGHGGSSDDKGLADGILTSSLGDSTSLLNSGSITVAASADSYAGAYGINAGNVGVNASVTNDINGTIDVTAITQASEAYAFGIEFSSIEANGSVSNAGTITVKAALGPEGTGRAYAYGMLNYDSVGDHGSLANSGVMSVTATGNVEAIAYGIVNGALNSNASITNTSSGSITATAHSTKGYYAYAYGIFNDNSLGYDAAIINNGSISATATHDGSYSAHAYGVDVRGNLGVNAAITNSGTVDATAKQNYYNDALAYGIYLDTMGPSRGVLSGNGAAVTNTNSGTINATAMIDMGYTGSATRKATAYGIYTGSLDGDNSTIANNGTINAMATATRNSESGAANAYAYGIHAGYLNGYNASVTNSGIINAVATEVDRGRGYAYGIYSSGMSDDTHITNSNIINATVNVGSSASYAAGTAYGIYLNNSIGNHATLTNNGSIVASANAMGQAEPYAYGIYVGGDLYGHASLTNSNSISATATGETSAYAYGIYIDSYVGTDATVTNSGIITATANAKTYNYASAIGIYVSSGMSGKLTNSGTITATAKSKASEAYAYGIYVDSNISGSLTNTGKITATAEGANKPSSAYAYGIYAIGLDGTLTNNGTISGSASVGYNGYALDIRYGSGEVINNGLLIGDLNLGGQVSMQNNGAVLIPTGSEAYIGGSYTQGAQGLIAIGATSTTDYARVGISGVADLTANSRIGVLVNGNTLQDGQQLLGVLSSDTQLKTGSTISVFDNSLALNFTAVQTGDQIDLTAHDSGVTTLAGAAAGSPLAGAASALDALIASDPTNPVLQGVFGVGSAADAVNAVQQASPLTGSGRAALNSMHGTQRVIGARQGALRGQSSGDYFIDDKEWWFKPFGSKADQSDKDGTPGFTADTYGLAIGADGELSAGNRIGAAFTYGHTKVDANVVDQSDTIDSYQGTIYGTHDLDNTTFLDYQADLGVNKNDSKRVLTMSGVTASSSYNSLTAHAGASLGRLYDMSPKTVFTPTVRLDYAAVQNDSYSEKGAGALDLNVNSHTTDELVLGVDGNVDYRVTERSKLSANLGLGYNALADRDTLTAAFAGQPGASFEATGVKPSSTSWNGGLGYTMTNAKAMQVTARYDIDGYSGFTNQTVSLKVMMPF